MSKITKRVAAAAKKDKPSALKKLSEVTQGDPVAEAKVTPKKKPIARKGPAKEKVPASKKTAPPPMGDNNPPPDEEEKPVKVGGIAAKQLKQFIKAVEDIDDEKRELDDEKKDIFAHAKDTGFDVKTMRKVIALRKMDKGDRDAAQDLVDTYMHALGDR